MGFVAGDPQPWADGGKRWGLGNPTSTNSFAKGDSYNTTKNTDDDDNNTNSNSDSDSHCIGNSSSSDK